MSFYDDVVAEAAKQGTPIEEQQSTTVVKVENVSGEQLVLVQSVEVDKVVVQSGRRAINEATVEALAESIREVGLLHPILITQENRLVSGLHRLMAVRRLGWTHVQAVRITLGILEVELAEIDENLVRHNLSALEQSEQLQRRRRVYLSIHPETGVHPRRRAPSDLGQPTFSKDTADKLGCSQREVQLNIQIAQKLRQDVRDLVRQHEQLANSKSELIKLSRVKDGDRQRQLVADVLAGRHKSITEAIRAMKLRDQHARASEESKTDRLVPDEGALPFPLLLVDPPWRTARKNADERPTMTVEELCDLRVSDLACDDALLFFWTPPSKIEEAVRILQAWEFSVRTCMVWDKQVAGPGFWVRQQAEFLLVAVRGRPPTPAEDDRPVSIFSAPQVDPGEKPGVVYELIERMYPTLRRCELFSRRARDGWVSVGYGMDRDIREVLPPASATQLSLLPVPPPPAPADECAG